MSDVKEKSLEDIFNEMPVGTKSYAELSLSEKGELRDKASEVRKDLSAAVNSFCVPDISADRLTEYGKVCLSLFLEIWVLYNAQCNERWEWDDRNRATYEFSLQQAEKYKEADPKIVGFYYLLAKAIHEDMHRTLQQSLMRIIYRYYLPTGGVVEHRFPMI